MQSPISQARSGHSWIQNITARGYVLCGSWVREAKNTYLYKPL